MSSLGNGLLYRTADCAVRLMQTVEQGAVQIAREQLDHARRPLIEFVCASFYRRDLRGREATPAFSHRRSTADYACGTSPVARIRSEPPSSSTGTPRLSALVSLEPAFGARYPGSSSF